MKILNKKSRLTFVILASLTIFFTIAATGPIINSTDTSPVLESEQIQKELVTIRNEAYRFEITVPKNWTYRKGVQPDPDEGMRTGEASFSISTGGSEEEPGNWNALVFTSTDSTEGPQPYIGISAHEKAGQQPEEFVKLLESTVTGYGGKVLNINSNFSVGDAKGFDCNYNLFVQSRYVALYRNGIRVIIHYYFPSNDSTLFGKHMSEVDQVIQSLRIE